MSRFIAFMVGWLVLFMGTADMTGISRRVDSLGCVLVGLVSGLVFFTVAECTLTWHAWRSWQRRTRETSK